MKLTYHRSFQQGLAGKYAKVVSRLPSESSVLEIGCHTGYFSRVLMDSGHKVLGIEKNEEAARIASNEDVPVICGDIENPAVMSSIKRKFDVVLLMDVLEHLIEPANVLKRLKSVLNEHGRIIVTGPNVAYWAVRKNLLLGRWNYQDAGILDKTHLHFYTALTWRSLIEGSGYKITAFEPTEGMIPLESILLKFVKDLESFRHIATAIAPTLFTTVWYIEARCK